MYKYSLKKECVCCNSSNIILLHDFGNVPSAGSFINSVNECELFPLSVSVCNDCFNIQVNEYINSDLLFEDYRYMSGFSMKSHFQSYLSDLKNRFSDFKSYDVLEIGSNDGTFLNILNNECKNVVGFEPSKNVSKVAIDSGANVKVDFFNLENAINNNLIEGSFDLITASNCFAHIFDIDSILDGVKYLLKPNGVFVVEVHYSPIMLKELQYDFIYHEHMYYYCLNSLEALFKRNGMFIYDFDFIKVHGGSIRVFAKKGASNILIDKIEDLKADEKKYYLNNIFKGIFSEKIQNHISDSRAILNKIKDSGLSIVGFGASGRVNAFLNYANITNEYIDYIFDESPERYGRIIPQVNIPIVKYDTSEYKFFDVLFLSAWNFSDSILLKSKNLNFKSTIKFFPSIEYNN